MTLTESLTTSAAIRCGDNGPDAKTAPVTIVANTGGVIDYPGFGALVFDLASYRPAKSKIPLDLNHDAYSSCGYLNRFDITDEGLVVKGAIVPFESDDYYSQLIHQLRNGVPYQASVESHDYTLEYIAPDVVTSVNNADVAGPVFIVRDWTLDAVAICKWGKDSDTNVSLAASLKNAAQKKKVLFKAQGNGEHMDKANETSPAVEATAPAAVEAPEVKDTTEVEVEVKAFDAVAVEAVETSEKAVADATASPAVIEETEKKVDETIVEVVAASDSRAEFKAFVDAFGTDKAATYFADGLTLADATAKYLVALKAENDELKGRLAAGRAGESQAIAFKDTHSAPGVTLMDILKSR